MIDSGRFLHLKPLGLPDPRGFTPHLRSVMLDRPFFQQLRTTRATFEGEHRWIIHDLLHILFYDFAWHSLGEDAFADAIRFYEIHLASEAFAVLALDYHVLSHDPGQGLAVDFDKNQWPEFQRLSPDLPHYRTADFARVLTDLYLTGEERLFRSRQPSEDFEHWAGHEIRYAEKQRLYAAQWRADLDGRVFDGQIPSVENSAAFEALWELLSLLLGESRPWESYTRSLGDRLPKNYFEGFKKYRGFQKADYRFTDFRALDPDRWKRDLEEALQPDASSLFLLWQLASSLEPGEWDEKHLRLFADLQKNANSVSQGVQLDSDLWRLSHEAVLRQSEKISEAPPRADLRACFFLP
jgi:hypothetical protein